MAYGNWGAWVFRNGELMEQWSDQTPYRESELAAGYLQAFGRREGLNPHHAVLGEKRVRLCGYKSSPSLFLDGEAVDLKPFVTNVYDTWTAQDGTVYEDADEWAGEIEGYRFGATFNQENMIDLWLIEPDGTRWTSRCGYEYGAGHDDAPRPEVVTVPS